jgi:hypothetical protein
MPLLQNLRVKYVNCKLKKYNLELGSDLEERNGILDFLVVVRVEALRWQFAERVAKRVAGVVRESAHGLKQRPHGTGLFIFILVVIIIIVLLVRIVFVHALGLLVFFFVLVLESRGDGRHALAPAQPLATDTLACFASRGATPSFQLHLLHRYYLQDLSLLDQSARQFSRHYIQSLDTFTNEKASFTYATTDTNWV